MLRAQRCLKPLLLLTTVAFLIVTCHALFTELFRFYVSKTSYSTTKVNESIEVHFRMISKDAKLVTVCQNLTCKADYLKHLQPTGYAVPPVRHLMWRSEYVSEYFAKQLATWQKVHPDWTVVLWRDDELPLFVKKHFPKAMKRFQELKPWPIMQVDMIRYMLLFKYGGVYADLDYSLVASLDEHRRFYAVVTREPEAHSLQFFGFDWPPRLMTNPALLMSAPGHSFYRYCIEQLQTKSFTKGQPLSFAGPFGLTQLLENYADAFPLANSPLETVYVPPSFSFYPYENNRMNTSGSVYMPQRLGAMRRQCEKLKSNGAEQLKLYCKDPENMDPITDKTQPVLAIHDMKKSGAIYDGRGSKFYFGDLKHVKSVFGSKLRMGIEWI